MVRDSSLSRETEQFSFIRTIAVHPQGDNESNESNDLHSHLSVKNDSHNLETSDVLALCKTSPKPQSSSLTIGGHATISDRWYTLDSSDNSTLSTVVILPESELPEKSETKGFGRYTDKICLIVAGGYLCFVFWWLFGSRNAMFPLVFLSKQETISQADAEFIDYMKQSLEVIDRKVEKQQLSASKVASSEEESSEVVYVPVYTPTPTSKADNNPNLSQPNTLLPPPPPPNQLAAIKPPVAPSEAVEIKTTPAIPSIDTSVTESTPPQEVKPEIAAATTQAKRNHTLVGVMELTEGSTALFKVNGVTQRIGLGEKIENTGWVLDSVANQQVIISQRGKSLTLNVGEKF